MVHFSATGEETHLRVAYDPQIFLRQRAGGVSRLFTELIREFDGDKGLGVNALLPFSTTNNALLTAALPERSFRTTPSWLPRGLLYAPWWVRGPRVGRHLDIVHHTYYGRRFLGAPDGSLQVTTIYDMIPELFSGVQGFTASHLAKREYVRECDLVICISESTRQDLVEVYGYQPERTVVVPLAVPSGFKPGLPRVSGLPSDYLMYVGKRKGYKDFSLLPMALEHLRDEGLTVPIVVVGPPFDSTEQADLRKRGLDHLVRQTPLDDQQLRRAYANATALVQTSRYEGFGLTPLEGMASGVPVVIANSSSMPEVGGDVALYFKPGDEVSLADALMGALLDKEKRADLSERGLKRASHFSSRRMAERTASAYLSLLDLNR